MNWHLKYYFDLNLGRLKSPYQLYGRLRMAVDFFWHSVWLIKLFNSSELCRPCYGCWITTCYPACVSRLICCLTSVTGASFVVWPRSLEHQLRSLSTLASFCFSAKHWHYGCIYRFLLCLPFCKCNSCSFSRLGFVIISCGTFTPRVGE